MRRILSDQSGKEESPRFCPNCGAANTGFGLRCTICGYVFEPADMIASYWDKVEQPDNTGQGLFIGEADLSEPDDDTPDETAVTAPYRPVVDPWSSLGGRLSADPGTTQAFTPPAPEERRANRDGGPPGWVLGLLGVLLIGIVAGATAVFVVRPLLADRVESAASEAIVAALAGATIAPDVASGTVVITEHEINRTIRANRGEYGPLDDLRVQIHRRGIVATFSVYGVSAEMAGLVKAVDGRIVIVNPTINGLAGRMIDVDVIAERAADAINDSLARSNLKPTAVTLADDTLTITTVPRG